MHKSPAVLWSTLSAFRTQQWRCLNIQQWTCLSLCWQLPAYKITTLSDNCLKSAIYGLVRLVVKSSCFSNLIICLYPTCCIYCCYQLGTTMEAWLSSIQNGALQTLSSVLRYVAGYTSPPPSCIAFSSAVDYTVGYGLITVTLPWN